MRIPALNSFVGVLIFFLLFCGLAGATDYYVSPTGTGNGLTVETPGDPSVLDNSLIAGDTMYFLNGTYNDETILLAASGTAGTPITLTSYSGVPFLDGNYSRVGESYHAAININGKSYITVSNLTATDYRYGVLTANTSGYTNVVVDNLTVYNTSSECICFNGYARNSTVTNCTLYIQSV